MKIVADANLLFTEGDLPAGMILERVDGRRIAASQLEDADALLVRSVTQVDAALLRDSGVRFVGTATSGTDHLDLEYLSGHGIQCCAAPGANADAVADYCLAAMAYAIDHLGLELETSTVGIVGAGNVGARLASRLADLHCPLLINDPPLAQAGVSEVAGQALCSLEDLGGCQVVSLHVPLTLHGEYPTQNFIDREFIKALPEGCILINTCRGEVIAADALQEALGNEKLHTVFDVWRNEPEVDGNLVQAATLATPHIAGYSTRAKRNGALQVLAQLQQFAVEQGFIAEDSKQLPESDGMEPFLMEAIPGASVWQVLGKVLPLARISQQFKRNLGKDSAANSFDLMRKAMQQRREFAEHWFAAEDLEESQLASYQACGFQVLR